LELVKFEKSLLEELAIILESPVDANTDLLADAGLDSFGTMQVIVFLEEEFGIQVPEDQFDINDFASVTTIARWALPLIDARQGRA
jgi:acyl carrier protein